MKCIHIHYLTLKISGQRESAIQYVCTPLVVGFNSKYLAPFLCRIASLSCQGLGLFVQLLLGGIVLYADCSRRASQPCVCTLGLVCLSLLGRPGMYLHVSFPHCHSVYRLFNHHKNVNLFCHPRLGVICPRLERGHSFPPCLRGAPESIPLPFHSQMWTSSKL